MEVRTGILSDADVFEKKIRLLPSVGIVGPGFGQVESRGDRPGDLTLGIVTLDG
jgi:hypothetical protein